MMGARTLLAVLFATACASGRAQGPDAVWLDSLAAYWGRINATCLDSARTPLPGEHRAGFTELERFAPDPRYRVTARFKPREGKDFGMPTTTDRVPVYRSVGTLHFELGGGKHRMTVYQDRDLIARKPEYANHLFVPFTDLTNGESTYGGGATWTSKAPWEATWNWASTTPETLEAPAGGTTAAHPADGEPPAGARADGSEGLPTLSGERHPVRA